MRSKKFDLVDLRSDYPCPLHRRRKGRLRPIILTEAFGCDCCQKIFSLEQNRQVLQELSSHYPYKRAWRWNGSRWIEIHPERNLRYLPVLLGILLVLMAIWLPFALRSPQSLSMIFWIGIASILITLPLLLTWLANRR